MKLKIRKGDIVQVITGNEKGSTGRVLETYPKKMRILVEGVNLRKRHSRATKQNPKGGIQEKELPVHYSNVMLMDAEKNPTRIGSRTDEKTGKTVRYAKTNGKDL